MQLGKSQQFASPEEALAHYGVKGMRWGHRKQDDVGGRSQARANDAAKRNLAKELTTSPTGQLTSVSTLGRASGKPLLSDTKLDPDTQTKSENFLKRADVLDTRISEIHAKNKALEGTKNPVKLYMKYENASNAKQLEKAKKNAIKDAEAVNNGKMTSKQKKVVVGALAVGGILAGGYLATKVAGAQQSGAFNSYQMLARQHFSGKKVPFRVNKELAGKMSAEDILKKVSAPVNPNFRSAGGQMNCRRATYVHELRRRGFDVSATTSAMGWGQSQSGVINAVTPGSKNFYDRMSMSRAVVDAGKDKVASGDTRTLPVQRIFVEGLKNRQPRPPDLNIDKLGIREYTRRMTEFMRKQEKRESISDYASNSKKVLEELAKQPNGARGEVLFKFDQFGHSMAYEVINGKAHIFDSQKANHYHAAGKMVEQKWDGFHSAEITRLDNVDLDLKFLTRWATDPPKAKK